MIRGKRKLSSFKCKARLNFLPSSTFSSFSPKLGEIRDLAELPLRTIPTYHDSKQNELLSIQWTSPPRNILLVKKDNAPAITDSLIEYARHIHSDYHPINILLEPHAAQQLQHSLPFPVYTTAATGDKCMPAFHSKVDLISTLGGDGTILHASSLFATTRHVPPMLSFSMGTLGFLGEWKFKEYKRAFREVYVSGARAGSALLRDNPRSSDCEASTVPHDDVGTPTTWSSIRGKSMGLHRGARVLLRNRLKVGIFLPNGQRASNHDMFASGGGDVYAMNEVIMHRGANPHLTIIDVFIGGRFLTETVADGMIISTPTGSTAYSLSSGGSIVHPLVSSLLLTPICPRSLSFRPLVLPAHTPITLKLSERNRGKEVEVSIDGVRMPKGMSLGMEVRVWGENIQNEKGNWEGGVPSIVRGSVGSDANGDDHWVGGLNGLLKFNYPFGEDA